MARGDDNVRVRVPDGMRNRIQAAAAVNKRSMNAEVVAMLESAIGTDGLRAYFAGQALVGLLSQPGMTIDIDGERLGEKRAGVCVAMADALIAELEKP